VVETGGLERRFCRLPKSLKNQLNPFASRQLAENWASLDFRCFCLICAILGDNLVTVVNFRPLAHMSVTSSRPKEDRAAEGAWARDLKK
jgi:hypothetical protein